MIHMFIYIILTSTVFADTSGPGLLKLVPFGESIYEWSQQKPEKKPDVTENPTDETAELSHTIEPPTLSEMAEEAGNLHRELAQKIKEFKAHQALVQDDPESRESLKYLEENLNRMLKKSSIDFDITT